MLKGRASLLGYARTIHAAGMARWWREIDWNWRAFGWREWAAIILLLVFVPGYVAFAVNWGQDAAYTAVWVVPLYLFMGINGFVAQNRARQGLPQLGSQPRPISDRALRLIFVGGFLAVALALLALIWWGSRFAPG